MLKGRQWQKQTRGKDLRRELSVTDAEEFLRMIKKSDYSVVGQLNHTPSRISIMSLLLSSEAHRESLMKILSADYVTKDIIVDQFDGVVTNLTSGACLSFNDNELLP